MKSKAVVGRRVIDPSTKDKFNKVLYEYLVEMRSIDEELISLTSEVDKQSRGHFFNNLRKCFVGYKK